MRLPGAFDVVVCQVDDAANLAPEVVVAISDQPKAVFAARLRDRHETMLGKDPSALFALNLQNPVVLEAFDRNRREQGPGIIPSLVFPIGVFVCP